MARNTGLTMRQESIGVARDPRLHLPNHVLDMSRHSLSTLAGEPVDLRPQALDLLCQLAQRPGEVVSKRELLAQVWPGVIVTDDSLVQAVSDARRAIGDDAHTVIQTVPRRGYRLIAGLPVAAACAVEPGEQSPALHAPCPGAERIPDVPAAAEVAGPTPEQHTMTSAAIPARPARPASRRAWIVALAVGVLLASGLAGLRAWQTGTQPRPVSFDRPPLAVLSFRDATASVEDQELARAYAQELTGELARNADLSVIAAYSGQTLADRGESPQQVARQLGARYLVDGQLRRRGDVLRLAVQFIDGRDGRVIWTDRQDIAAGQVVAARDALVDRIAGSLHSTMRRDQETSARSAPATLDVYAMTLNAIDLKHRFNPPDTLKARAMLERVVSLDPDYAPGWLYLGYVNTVDLGARLTGPRTPERIQQAIKQIEHSIRLNPNLPPAYAALANLYIYSARYPEAERAARHCLQLGPSDAECAIFLSATLVAAGKPEEALGFARRAMAATPLPAPHVLAFYGQSLWASMEFDLAINVLSDCLQQAPQFVLCRVDRMLALAESGKIESALADAAELHRTFAGVPLEALVAVDISPNATQLLERIAKAVQRVKKAEALRSG